MADAELDVHLGETLVAHLRERSYRVSFSFADEYLEASQRPVLGQWFEDRLHEGPFHERHGGLLAFFENLLPSDVLRLLIKVQHQLDEPTDRDILAVVAKISRGRSSYAIGRISVPLASRMLPPSSSRRARTRLGSTSHSRAFTSSSLSSSKAGS